MSHKDYIWLTELNAESLFWETDLSLFHQVQLKNSEDDLSFYNNDFSFSTSKDWNRTVHKSEGESLIFIGLSCFSIAVGKRKNLWNGCFLLRQVLQIIGPVCPFFFQYTEHNLKINYTFFILNFSLFLQNPQNIHRKDFLIVISSVLMLTHLHSNQSVIINNLFFAFLLQLPHDKKDKGTKAWKEAQPE